MCLRVKGLNQNKTAVVMLGSQRTAAPAAPSSLSVTEQKKKKGRVASRRPQLTLARASEGRGAVGHMYSEY